VSLERTDEKVANKRGLLSCWCALRQVNRVGNECRSFLLVGNNTGRKYSGISRVNKL